jgi:hypothetical protein
MSKVMNVMLSRRMMAPAGLAVLLCGVTGCAPVQSSDLASFVQDFVRNLMTALVL